MILAAARSILIGIDLEICRFGKEERMLKNQVLRSVLRLASLSFALGFNMHLVAKPVLESVHACFVCKYITQSGRWYCESYIHGYNTCTIYSNGSCGAYGNC